MRHHADDASDLGAGRPDAVDTSASVRANGKYSRDGPEAKRVGCFASASG